MTMQDAQTDDFSSAAFRRRVQERLHHTPREAGDHILNPTFFHDHSLQPLRDAAVLIAVVDRGPQANVLLTLRTDHLASHAGQIAFPGGKVEQGDADATATALREADEEIGLSAAYVDPIGRLGDYLTGSGYRIAPVVAVVREGFTLAADPGEVADVFEVPLKFLMSPGNHQRLSREWKGHQRSFYAMPYESRYIWGATAGILRTLYDTIYAE